MNDLQKSIERFSQRASLLQHDGEVLERNLIQWHEELIRREAFINRELATIKKQREDLILKSNLIVEQVNGLRGQKEQAAQKMLEAEKLKKSAEEQLETAENLNTAITIREDELTIREAKQKRILSDI